MPKMPFLLKNSSPVLELSFTGVSVSNQESDVEKPPTPAVVPVDEKTRNRERNSSLSSTVPSITPQCSGTKLFAVLRLQIDLKPVSR